MKSTTQHIYIYTTIFDRGTDVSQQTDGIEKLTVATQTKVRHEGRAVQTLQVMIDAATDTSVDVTEAKEAALDYIASPHDATKVSKITPCILDSDFMQVQDFKSK